MRIFLRTGYLDLLTHDNEPIYLHVRDTTSVPKEMSRNEAAEVIRNSNVPTSRLFPMVGTQL